MGKNSENNLANAIDVKFIYTNTLKKFSVYILLCD